MQIPRSLLVALFSAPLLAFAQSNANPFDVQPGFSASVGTPVTLKWKPTTSGTVTLILRSGPDSNNLDAGTTIQSGIPNSGMYKWTPDASIVDGDHYTVEIVDDSDPTKTNYYPFFSIDSPTTAATTSMSTVSLGAPTTSLSLSTLSATTTATSFSTSTASSSSASGTASSSSSSGSSSSQTGSTTTSAPTSSTSGGAQFQSTTPTNAAPRATAMAGMLGIVALGAMAL